MQNIHSDVYAKLISANLRPTRQRLLLARLLFTGPNRHVTAEELYREASAKHAIVSLATVYNTLHQFTEAKLLREVLVGDNASYFDTNTSPHHHFLHEDTKLLTDIPEEQVSLGEIPRAPEGTTVNRVDVVIRISDTKAA